MLFSFLRYFKFSIFFQKKSVSMASTLLFEMILKLPKTFCEIQTCDSDINFLGLNTVGRRLSSNQTPHSSDFRHVGLYYFIASRRWFSLSNPIHSYRRLYRSHNPFTALYVCYSPLHLSTLNILQTNVKEWLKKKPLPLIPYTVFRINEIRTTSIFSEIMVQILMYM